MAEFWVSADNNGRSCLHARRPAIAEENVTPAHTKQFDPFLLIWQLLKVWLADGHGKVVCFDASTPGQYRSPAQCTSVPGHHTVSPSRHGSGPHAQGGPTFKNRIYEYQHCFCGAPRILSLMLHWPLSPKRKPNDDVVEPNWLRKGSHGQEGHLKESRTAFWDHGIIKDCPPLWLLCGGTG